MSARSALVTGATGCLGRHLTGLLIAAGWRVRASGRNPAIGAALAGDGAEFVAADLLDPDIPNRLTQGIDVVFHCAALSSPWGPAHAFRAANVEATRALASAARTAGCNRFVHVSSPSIHFAYRDAFEITENDPLPRRCVNAYAASKAEAERVVIDVADRELPVVIFRPRGIFGEFDTALAPRLMRFASQGRMPLLRGGKATVDVTYAGNVADAMLLAAAEDAPTGIFNLTNGEPLTVRELLTRTFAALGREIRFVKAPYPLLDVAARISETSARLLGLPEPRLLPYTLGVMAYSQTLDISAARTRLGYTPRVSIDDGLQRYAAWLRQQGNALALPASAPAQGASA